MSARHRGELSRLGRTDTPRSVGPERVLLALYLLFAVAAGARSAVQLATHAHRAPLAYGLSAAAALIYLGGLVLVLRAARGRSRRALAVWSGLELVAVLVVGTVSVLDGKVFADATVWSYYGAGYLFVPLVLPLTVLGWLRRTDVTMGR